MFLFRLQRCYFILSMCSIMICLTYFFRLKSRTYRTSIFSVFDLFEYIIILGIIMSFSRYKTRAISHSIFICSWTKTGNKTAESRIHTAHYRRVPTYIFKKQSHLLRRFVLPRLFCELFVSILYICSRRRRWKSV